jgi:threonyl-tRNA synthetase
MRILSIHASSMWYHATQKTKMAEPVTVREDRMDECVVLFCCVEKLDEKNPDQVVRGASSGVLERLGKLKVKRVMIYPYAHLASSLGQPGVALGILKGLESSLRESSIEVKRAPFGWYKEFEIRGKGHPLADLSMTICPYDGSERDFSCPYCNHPIMNADLSYANISADRNQTDTRAGGCSTQTDCECGLVKHHD